MGRAMPLLGSIPPRRRGIPGLLAVTLMVLGPVLAWAKAVAPLVGFGLFALGGLAAVVIGGVTVVQTVRGRGFTRGGLVALLASVAFIGLASRGMGVPRINDFTTDLDHPPVFRKAATLPANQGRDLTFPSSFTAAQRACCPDLHPARLRGSTDDAYARAEQVARTMPAWVITASDATAGTIEATTTSRVFGFVDDIVIRVQPDGGGQVRVDIRSKSRDGKGDLGANAARIRQYIEALEATAPDRP